jgi:protein tyrosine phosphatase (PTP) superfamily phosphohydrolase (DUF442 family)
MNETSGAIEPRRTGWRVPMRGVLVGLGLMLVAEVLRVFTGSNFHTVVAQRCYRSGQPSPADLRDLVGALGIRTVINLRGRQAETEAWYLPEVEAARTLGIGQIDITMSAYTPPPEKDLCALVRALDDSPGPLLLHCHSGSDRTGLAAALYLLLKTDTPLAEARRQIHPRFGHNPWGAATCPRLVLGQYADWLSAHGWQHRPELFRRWACAEYRNCPSGTSPRRAVVLQ